MAYGRKTGGRQKGVQNRTTTMTKQVIASLLSDYSESGLMNKDFASLDAKDRLTIAERLMQYTIPKMQATAVDLSAGTTKKTIVDTLTELSQETESKRAETK